jgi:hypothetical protein
MPHQRGIPKIQRLLAKKNSLFFLHSARFGFVLLTFFIAFVSCGHRDNSQIKESQMEEVFLSFDDEAPLSLLETLDTNSQSVVPDSVVVVLTGCESGFTAIHNTALSGSTLYINKHDRNCILSLRSVLLNGTTFTNTTGGDFAGSGMGVFVNTTDNRKLAVKNTTLLPNPVSSGARVAFSLSEIAPGKNNFQLLARGPSGTLLSSSGNQEPLLKWFNGPGAIELVNVDKFDVATYRTKLECAGEKFVTKNPLKKSLCKTTATEQQLNEYYLRVVDDIYSNGSALSLKTAQRLFGYTGWTGIATPGGDGVVKVSVVDKVFDKTATNSGGIVVDLEAPSKITNCRNHLVLVLHNPSGNRYVSQWSFAYFNLDFASKNNTCTN